MPVEQAYVRDPDKTVQDVVMENIAKFGENINIRRFVRYEMSEGLQSVKITLLMKYQNR